MGQCPHCGHSLYIPLAAEGESEPLELVETDPAEEARMQKEMEHARQTMRQILTDKDTTEPDDHPKETPRDLAGRKPKPIDPEDASLTVEQYVLAMSQSCLDEAEALAAHLLGNPETVNPIINKALKDGLIHPHLQGVPEAVQKGFLKKLFDYLNP